MAKREAPKKYKCQMCNGKGTVTVYRNGRAMEETCPQCSGEGEL